MHLGGQIICKVLLYRFSFFFLFQNQIENDVYVFLYDIIRFFGYKIESTLLFAISVYMIIFTMMNTSTVFCSESSSNSFFSVSAQRNPSEHIIQFTIFKIAQLIDIDSQFIIFHVCDTLNYKVPMISVSVDPSFMHSHLPKSTIFELRWWSLLITLCIAKWQSNWGVLKGS